MRIFRIFLPALLVISAAACNDTLGPTNWDATPDTVTLYSASRPELTGYHSGFDFTTPGAVTVESVGAASAFDILLTEQSGHFALAPAGALTGQSNRAGLARVSASSLAAVAEAPKDTAAYQQLAPIQVQSGDLFVVRSRRVNCIYTTGSYYAKLQVISTDPTAGTLKFAYVRNPYCSNQSLIPPGK